VSQTYFVPARESQAGTLALGTGRLTSGERIGLAFTSKASLLLTTDRFSSGSGSLPNRSATYWHRSESGQNRSAPGT
jgi:hypothetical protein